jgi:hypothetical protein
MYDGPHISNNTRVVTGLKCVNKHAQRLAPLSGPMRENRRFSGEALSIDISGMVGLDAQGNAGYQARVAMDRIK